MQDKKSYIVHIIYAGSFLIAVLAVVGYLFWNKEQAIKQFKLVQQITEQNEEHKEAAIKVCLTNMSTAYLEDWAAACKNLALRTENQIQDCVKEAATFSNYMQNPYVTASQTHKLFLLKVAQCKSMYGTPDPRPNCMLPPGTAQAINKELSGADITCKNENS